MTLQDTINTIVSIAKTQPNIRTVILDDIYRLDAMPNAKYCVFGVTQNTHRWADNMLQISLNLYYIDRLTTDSHNELQIQSTGIEVLQNIISAFVEKCNLSVYNSIVEFHTFIQKFSDLTAGAYATLSFEIPTASTDCFEDFN